MTERSGNRHIHVCGAAGLFGGVKRGMEPAVRRLLLGGRADGHQ